MPIWSASPGCPSSHRPCDVKRSLSVFLSTLAAALVTPPAWAQNQATEQSPQASTLADAVELKNGAYLRGLILEVDPASHLTLKLPSGEVRRIPIAEIASAERSGRPLKLPNAPATPSASPTGPSEAPPAGETPAPKAKPQRELDRLLAAIPGPRVTLTVTANRDAYLERLIGSADGDLVAYHLVCRVPCRLELPALDPIRYRIDGRRTEPTDWFQLPRHNAHVEADLVSNMWPLWPRALLVGGTIFGLVGGGMIGGWALDHGGLTSDTANSTWVRDVGIGLASVGGGMYLTSGVLFLVRPTTSLGIERRP